MPSMAAVAYSPDLAVTRHVFVSSSGDRIAAGEESTLRSRPFTSHDRAQRVADDLRL